jgi:hypothetical protein
MLVDIDIFSCFGLWNSCTKFVPTLQFFFYLVCDAIGTAATPGLLCHPQVIVKMIVEKQMECRLAGETEVLGENLLQRQHKIPHDQTQV